MNGFFHVTMQNSKPTNRQKAIHPFGVILAPNKKSLLISPADFYPTRTNFFSPYDKTTCLNLKKYPTFPLFCDSYRIQTYNLLIRSQMLYSVELRSQSSFLFGCKITVSRSILQTLTHFFRSRQKKNFGMSHVSPRQHFASGHTTFVAMRKTITVCAQDRRLLCARPPVFLRTENCNAAPRRPRPYRKRQTICTKKRASPAAPPVRQTALCRQNTPGHG